MQIYKDDEISLLSFTKTAGISSHERRPTTQAEYIIFLTLRLAPRKAQIAFELSLFNLYNPKASITPSTSDSNMKPLFPNNNGYTLALHGFHVRVTWAPL